MTKSRRLHRGKVMATGLWLIGSALIGMAAPLAAQGVAASAPDQTGLAAAGEGTPHDPAAAAPTTAVDPGTAEKDQTAVPAGRADENVVRQAQDAFGATIGRETIGIYSSGSVRGFSPIAAGNVRIGGLYFDQVGSLNSRIRRSTDIRVGLSVQGYAFPAPTGVVDYSLREPGKRPILSATVDGSSYGTRNVEFDGELPLTSTLSVGAGFGLYRNGFSNGTRNHQNTEALIAHWQPTPGFEVVPFWSRSRISDNQIGPLLEAAGPFLPPHLPRGRFYGPDWALFAVENTNYGLTGSITVAPGWTVDAGLFRSVERIPYDIYTFLSGIQRDGSADYEAFPDPPKRQASISGEVRLTRSFAEGPRTHAVLISFRDRDRVNRYNGSDYLDFGKVKLGDPLNFPKPPITFTDQNLDHTRQWTVGAAYLGRWRDVGELSFGVSRTDYRKSFGQPGSPTARVKDTPLLYNVAGALDVTHRLAVYADYTRGLEETGVAPQNAANRNQALPAIITEQKDAGLRWNVLGDLKLVVGVFDIRKPYLSFDRGNVYTTIGDTRNRGVESSISGSLPAGVHIALGGVFLYPKVVGAAGTAGVVGKRPVGVPLRSLDLNVDWLVPGQTAFSFDLGVINQGRVATLVDNSVFIPSQTLLNIGGRYRFRIAASKATLRVSVTNLTNKYAFSYFGPGLYDAISSREVDAYLAVDI